ncbi:DUF1588 domain-containing protein [Nannocystaceae bacterium ST9]
MNTRKLDMLRLHRSTIIVLAALAAGCTGASGHDDAADSADESGDETASDTGEGDGGDGDESDECAAGREGAPLIRRLTHHEWNASVGDLLGQPIDAASAFAPDNVVEGWSNDAGALSVSALLADQYRGAAEQLASTVDVAALVGCDAIADELGCVDAFVREFGLRAFRRPLADAEVERYLDLYGFVADEDGYEEGVRWVLSTMLQSPNFLYRTELGEPDEGERLVLTDYELASELSYLILGTTPDAELLSAAANGELGEVEQLLAQTDRLLDDPRAVDRLDQFTDDWLHLGVLPTLTRDPALTPELRVAMLHEARSALSSEFLGGGTLAELLTSRTTRVDAALAQFLGYPFEGTPDAEGFVEVTLPDHVDGGLLARGALLATHALPTSSSPIHRGKLVRERLLCQPLPPPPPALDTSPPEDDPSKSTRERYEQHTADPACSGCHSLIDGIGFAFEHYDGLGRWREVDGEHAIDAQGEIIATEHTNAEFDGLGQLSELLSTSPDVEACYTEQWARFALGSKDATACVDDELAAALAAEAGQLDAVLYALIQADHFRYRQAPADMPTPDPDPGESDSGEADSGESTSTSSSSGDEGSEGGVDVEVVTDNDWGTGACKTATVTNSSDAAVVWAVEIDTGGTLSNFWNAITSDPGPIATFVGEGYNAELAAGATTSFGFCITY